MTIRSVVLGAIAVTSVGLILPQHSFGYKYAGLTDELGNATTSVLSKLGYDCQTASVGIVCKKCKVEDDQQKCEAFICDAVTKKCRKKSASIPQLPNFNRDNDD